jgi:hypothetical protein
MVKWFILWLLLFVMIIIGIIVVVIDDNDDARLAFSIILSDAEKIRKR